jgi:uncharacterized membrane protein
MADTQISDLSTPVVAERLPSDIEKEAEFLRPFLKDPAQAPSLVQQVVSFTKSYRGPIPPPEYLSGFEAVVPGSARQVIDMAVRQQSHRHGMERRDAWYSFAGLAMGGVTTLSCIGGAVFLAMHDRADVAHYLVGVPVLGAAIWFVRARLDKP